MFFEMIDGISWGWLVFFHLLAILLIWIPLGYDAVFSLISPVKRLFDDDDK